MMHKNGWHGRFICQPLRPRCDSQPSALHRHHTLSIHAYAPVSNRREYLANGSTMQLIMRCDDVALMLQAVSAANTLHHKHWYV